MILFEHVINHLLSKIVTLSGTIGIASTSSVLCTTINDIASIFKGGGHKFAAGAFVKNGNVEEIKNIILDELRKKIT